jgi:hypothetical protein
MKKHYKIIFAFLLALPFLGCESDDDTLVDLEQVKAPANLGATFQITQDNSGLVEITPTGEGATVYTVDFGDSSAPAEGIKVGGSVEHIYAEGEYEVEVTGTNINGKTATGIQPLIVSFLPPENLEVVITKGDDGYSASVSATADYAAMFEVYFGDEEGEEPTPLMIGETISHTYAEIGSYDIRVVALSVGEATIDYTESVEITGPPSVPEVAAPTPDRLPESVISLYSNAYTNVPVDTWRTDWSVGDLEDLDIEGDDVKKYSNLNYVGILTESTQVDATEMTHFNVDIWSPNATTFRVKLVDFGPNGVYDGGGDDVEFEVAIENPAQGEWVSVDIPLSDFTGLTTRAHISQYILSAAPADEATVFIDNVFFYNENIVTPSGPLTAAPTPYQAEENVISLFSAKYTDNPVDTWRTDWSVGDLEETSILGDDVKKYTNLSYVGILTEGTQIDATDMTHFRTDIWTPNGTAVKVKLVDFGPNGVYDGGGDDTEHEVVIENPERAQWVSLDIPLSDFTGLTTRAHISQLLYSADTAGEATLFVDNVFFYNENGTTSNMVTLPVSFENSSLAYSLTPFEGAESAVEANPFQQGINPSNTVVRSTKTEGAQFFAGTTLQLEEPIDFSSTEKISVKVYSPKAGIPVRMKLENNDDSGINMEIDVNTTVANQWEELVFDFSDKDTSQEYSKVIMFFEFIVDLSGDGSTYYYDDIQLKN